MRHKDSGRKLNRTSSHRRAMMRNMSNSLVTHELIRTTLPKAKELRRFIEPLITLAGTDTVANRRRMFSKLRNDDAVGKLFTDLGPRYKERLGGYTRILKDGHRAGDKAPMSVVELVDKPERVDDPDRARATRFKMTAGQSSDKIQPQSKNAKDTKGKKDQAEKASSKK